MNDAETPSWRAGHRLGFLVGSTPVVREIAWAIGRFFLLLFRICEFLVNRYYVFLLRLQSGKKDATAYLGYSRPHQYDYFLGDRGVVRQYADLIAAEDWRANRQTFVRSGGKPPRGSQLERLISWRWGVRNMREHLPFVVVFGRWCHPRTYELSSAYRRRRDAPTELADAVLELREDLDKAHSAGAG
jgi:hypothetical protein